MEHRKIRFSIEALNDLRQIEAYISEHNEAAAGRVIRSIHSSISHLAAHPLMGIVEPNGNGRLLFEPRYGFAISYSASEAGIEIRYVFHPRQNRL